MASSSLLRPLPAGAVSGDPLPLFPNKRVPAPLLSFSSLPQPSRRRTSRLAAARTKATAAAAATAIRRPSPPPPQTYSNPKLEVEEVEEELSWVEEKALDAVEYAGAVAKAVPGPRVGQGHLPWLIAVPLMWAALAVISTSVKTVKKVTSPRAQRRKLVNKNAFVLTSIDQLFAKGRDEVSHSHLNEFMRKTGFTMEEILRKYIRYSLNEKPFNAELVVDLILLRTASQLEDMQVAEVLNDVSRRIVKEKGPVVMDLSGFTEKGFKRKLAVQAIFGKIFYLSELPEFCLRDNSLVFVKEIFGVTDEDADALRLQTLSQMDGVGTIKNMANDPEVSEATHGSSAAAAAAAA